MITTREIVINEMISNTFYESVLKKYLSNKDERDEFRQVLWVILLEMDENKLIKYYDTKCLQYVYIGIINNQIKSSSSPWHRKHRLEKANDSLIRDKNANNPNNNSNNDSGDMTNSLNDEEDTSLYDITYKENMEIKLDYIENKLNDIIKNDAFMIRDVTVFKMHFIEELTYREISKKTLIPVTSIFNYIKNIKQQLIKNKPTINNDYNDYIILS